MVDDPGRGAADDQWRASRRDAAALQERVRRILGERAGRPTPVMPLVVVPAWERHVDLMMWPFGLATCGHVDPERTALIVTMAWRPGVLVCRPCANRGETTVRDPRCDGCGASAPLSDGAVRDGTLVWIYRLCPGCSRQNSLPPTGERL